MNAIPIDDFYRQRDDLFRGRMMALPCDGDVNGGQVLADLVRLEMPLAYIDADGAVLALAFPAVFMPDFYYGTVSGRTFVATSLTELAQLLNDVTYDERELTKLVTKSYCTPSRTPLNEVSRFEGYKLYRVSDGCLGEGDYLPFEELSWESDEACYQDFKRRIDHAIDYYLDRFKGHKMHLLLSGGVDSRLIFLSLVKRGVEFDTQSLVYVPTSFDDNFKDVALAQEVSRLAGVSHNITEVDVDKLEESYLVPVVESMPCCAHATFGFKVPIDHFCSEGDVIWTGQNMDTLYNMGATARFKLEPHAIAQMFKRWYLSEPYARTFPDVEGSPSLFARPFSALGVAVFRRGYHDPSMNLPANAVDFLERFAVSDDYVVTRPGELTPAPLGKKVTPHELKEMVFLDKLGYARGGDAQSIATCARLNGGEAVFPYVTTELLQWFNSYRLGMKDVRSPKRFVYRYTKELADSIEPGLGTFDAPELDDYLKGIKGVDLYSHARGNFETKLFHTMRDVAGGGAPSRKELEGRGAWTAEGELIREYWVAAFERSLEQGGVNARHKDVGK